MATIQTIFLCGLDQIGLPTSGGRGEKFAGDYFVITDASRIEELIRPFGGSLGTVEHQYLAQGAAALAYRRGVLELDVADDAHIAAALAERLLQDMLALHGLASALWAIKDNACHFDRAWIMSSTAGRTIVNNNTWASRLSRADGSFDRATFSVEEFRQARASHRPLGEYLTGADAPTLLTRGSLRFQRFEYFIGAARASLDVAMKIAQYCSALESLVSTAHQELSHQVSERVAAVLAQAGSDRLAIYKQVKKAYAFRSKTVHGTPFGPNDVEQLRECSCDIDRVCRNLQSTYLGNDPALRDAVEGSQERATQHFLEAVLGGNVAAPETGPASNED